MSLLQASQQWLTISSWLLKTRLESQLSRMNRQTLSTELSSGERGGRGTTVILAGPPGLAEVCQPA